MAIIETRDLTKVFETTIAVNKLNLKVEKGEIFGLVGPDGAGKTTTIRLLTSIMKPTSGTARIDDKDSLRQSEDIREVIGYMSQRFGLYQDLTVLENIQFYADIYGLSTSERNQKIEELLTFSQLIPFKNRLAGNLSGGMKQKLGLACALVHTPKVLFLDEPTNGVDPRSRHEFWRILHELLNEKVTIFLSTSYMDEAEKCNHVGFIYSGSLLIQGTPTEIKEKHPGKVFQLQVENPREASRILQKELGTDAVTLFGNRIHILTLDEDSTLKIAKHLLPEVERNPSKMQLIPPSLEDTFIALLSTSQSGTSV